MWELLPLIQISSPFERKESLKSRNSHVSIGKGNSYTPDRVIFGIGKELGSTRSSKFFQRRDQRRESIFL
ncbi:hypothetical protein DLM75_06515 [Leptospira stimsonii]|uniref:Uncharacterized protein n=1 Tax=Leptospira stimsonii TaxID=2202203 RepID=A0A396ZEX7_9LEPT|nr:hypothetical protein DLM75_06515 [Leptospira stimsonii]